MNLEGVEGTVRAEDALDVDGLPRGEEVRFTHTPAPDRSQAPGAAESGGVSGALGPTPLDESVSPIDGQRHPGQEPREGQPKQPQGLPTPPTLAIFRRTSFRTPPRPRRWDPETSHFSICRVDFTKAYETSGKDKGLRGASYRMPARLGRISGGTRSSTGSRRAKRWRTSVEEIPARSEGSVRKAMCCR